MLSKHLSRSVVFLNTNIQTQRIGLLKPLQCLEAMSDEEEDVFQKGILDRYRHRPSEMEQMSYAEFGANYKVQYKDECKEDSLPLIMANDAVVSRKIKHQ